MMGNQEMTIRPIFIKTICSLNLLIVFFVHSTKMVLAEQRVEVPESKTESLKGPEMDRRGKVELEPEVDLLLWADRTFFQSWSDGWFWYIDPKAPVEKGKAQDSPKPFPHLRETSKTIGRRNRHKQENA